MTIYVASQADVHKCNEPKFSPKPFAYSFHFLDGSLGLKLTEQGITVCNRNSLK